MTLYELAQDKTLIKELKDHFNKVIELEAVRMLFAREDTSHIADAKDLIETVFETFQSQEKVKTTITSSR